MHRPKPITFCDNFDLFNVAESLTCAVFPPSKKT